MLLTRQDSNLDPLNQNQWCYQLHYGSIESVRAEGFEPTVPLRATALQAAATNPYSPRTQHLWQLPEQDSNLQSRINSPLVYRLTDRGIVAIVRAVHRARSGALRTIRPPARQHHTGTGTGARRNRSRSLGSNGSRIIVIPASSGVRLSLRPLHEWHAATRLIQWSAPPRLLGRT